MSSSPPKPRRLPRNATPIPLPSATLRQSPRPSAAYSLGTEASPSFDANASHVDLPTRSPSALSEIEVVLDDGTLQKRTVSLSTIPGWQFSSFQDYDASEEEEEEEEENEEAIEPSQRAGLPYASGSQETLDTTPLLDDCKTSYYSVGSHPPLSGSSSSTSNGSDSDTPFFPVGKGKHRRHAPINVEPVHGSSVWRWLERNTTRMLHTLQPTAQQRLVLKCSFAYLLGALFTFVPALNALIGNNRTSSHLVATATVFFNPAKTLGGMVEAAAYGWGYTLFAVAVCLGSMITTDFFVDRNLFIVAHAISLVFWLAGATFIISFLKAHWNKPPVATASSLCFIIIFIIVVREGSANRGDFDTTRIEQITSAVATGTLITVSCCVLFWPVSAAKKLKKDLEATLTSYKILLKLLTKTFLLDDDLPEFKANRTLHSAIESHRASFTALQKSLKEAKLEMVWNSEIRSCADEYDRIVTSMQRLAQYVGGLRSSCGLQFDLMSHKHDVETPKRSQNKSAQRPARASTGMAESWSIRADHRRRKMEDEMRRQRMAMSPTDLDDRSYKDSVSDARPLRRSTVSSVMTSPDLIDTEDAQIRVEEEAEAEEEEGVGSLIEFIQTIRQPLKSLAYTCKQTIFHLQLGLSGTASLRVKRISPGYAKLKENLVKAIALFEISHRQAVQRLHRHRQRRLRGDFARENSVHGLAPGDDVFLVYFFVYNMIEFARELIDLVEAMEQLDVAKRQARCIGSWLLFWRSTDHHPHHHSGKGHHPAPSFHGFVPNERNTKNTLHTPEAKTRWRKFFIRLWRTFSLFKLQKIRYAIKASVAATLLATPAFLDSSGAIFREWRMEWALITLMVVMTPTVGGTNLVVIYRIFSTILGCYTAMLFYLLFPGNMYVLALLTWLFSIPNFWIILNHKHGKFGQFTLLAFNLVMLNKYNDRDHNSIAVWLLATQRCIAILVGVFVGLVATAYVWPYEARVELRKGLSDFLLRLAWLYQKLVAIYSENPHDTPHALFGDPPRDSLPPMTPAARRRLTQQSFMDLELGLQRTLLDLQDLLAQTPNEPRLKGPFPVATYSAMLGSCQNIVDKFLSLRTVILKDVWFDEVQRDFIMPVNHDRKEMVGNVLLYFYLLASALRLKTPLPPYMPPARKAWQTLLLRLRQLPAVQSQQLVDKDHVYVFYYAYVTMMEEIIRELDKLGSSMTQLFGALVPADQWDSLFAPWDIEQARVATMAVPIERGLSIHQRS